MKCLWLPTLKLHWNTLFLMLWAESHFSTVIIMKNLLFKNNIGNCTQLAYSKYVNMYKCLTYDRKQFDIYLYKYNI